MGSEGSNPSPGADETGIATMLKFVSFLYEKLLERRVLNSSIPLNHILLVLDETDLLSDENEQGLEKLRHFIQWCYGLQIDIITVYISVIRSDGTDSSLVKNGSSSSRSRLEEEIRRVLSNDKTTASFVIYRQGHSHSHSHSHSGRTELEHASASASLYANSNDSKIQISLGFGGRSELTKAVKEIVKKVEREEVEPEEIDEKLIESELFFKSEPELVIRSGTTRLMDFYIWQSVYTEFYFTDINWSKFRKIDLLRAVRDFKMRERRFGG